LDFIEACRKLISLDSTPLHGTKSVVEYLQSLAQGMNLHVEVQNEIINGLEQSNILIRPNEIRSELEFLLQNHLDTADPGPFQLWDRNRSNPFEATITDGNIYGVGAADVKCDFLCKLFAMKSFVGTENWKLPPVLVGTFGEETGMLGALRLIRKNKINAKLALIGEPSDMQVINAGKGFASVEIKIPFSEEEKAYRKEHNLRESASTQSKLFAGKPAHSSMPHLGESAIVKMFEHILKLPQDLAILEIDGGINYNTVPSNAFLELDLVSLKEKNMISRISEIYSFIVELEKEFLQFQDPEFFPPYPTLSIGCIRTFEDHVALSGNCRMPPVITQQTYEIWMQRLSKICQDNFCEFKILNYKKPFRTSQNSILAKACLDTLRGMGVEAQCLSQASTNEASLFSRIGMDCICFGPGKREGNTHTPYEHVRLDDLQRSTEFYQKMIERICK